MAPSFDPSAAAAPGSGAFGLTDGPGEARVHILPIPFDATCSFRRGAAGGPEAIRTASAQVELHDLVVGRPYEAGIWMAPSPAEVEAWNAEARALADPILAAGGPGADTELLGNAARVDAIQQELEAWLFERASLALEGGKLLAVVGGDHSVPLGAIRAHAERHRDLAVLHFDAHADLRPGYEGFSHSHASILHHVARLDPVSSILQVGVRDLCEEERAAIDGGRIRAVFGTDWAAARLEGRNLRALIRRELEPLPRDVYVTFDIDGLDPSLCPNTGTPVPGGLSFDEASAWLEELVRSGRRIVGFDLCEVAPAPGGEAGKGWDEIVGSRLLYRLIGFALGSR
ncbi:MAG TPA: agmatinase family protein [Planctomycetes bacterium]|nr:agmatinase family protein [Planctomycetota bacterium]